VKETADQAAALLTRKRQGSASAWTSRATLLNPAGDGEL